MTFEEIKLLIDAEVECSPWRFEVIRDEKFCHLKATYDEPCVVTGQMSVQTTRKWYLSPYMTKSEIVQTALKLCLTSAEHQVREHFKYKGELVYGPHWDVDSLHEMARAGRLSLRPEWPKPQAVSASGD